MDFNKFPGISGVLPQADKSAVAAINDSVGKFQIHARLSANVIPI